MKLALLVREAVDSRVLCSLLLCGELHQSLCRHGRPSYAGIGKSSGRYFAPYILKAQLFNQVPHPRSQSTGFSSNVPNLQVGVWCRAYRVPLVCKAWASLAERPSAMWSSDVRMGAIVGRTDLFKVRSWIIKLKLPAPRMLKDQCGMSIKHDETSVNLRDFCIICRCFDGLVSVDRLCLN